MTKIDYSVRAITRGLEVLQAINQLGQARYIDVARITSIPYPTVCRIINTLQDIGMVEREANGFGYRPTAMVQSLSVGFEDDDSLIRIARPFISALCDEVGWPITLTTRVGASMIIRDSTHRQTTMTYHNYSPGYALPLLDCSVGKAYFAFCGESERRSIIASLTNLGETSPALHRVPEDIEAFIGPTQSRGFAYHTYNEHTKDPGKTSSMAVPVFVGGELKAAMGLIYFSSTMLPREAAARYLGPMQKCASDIEQAVKTSAQDMEIDERAFSEK